MFVTLTESSKIRRTRGGIKKEKGEEKALKSAGHSFTNGGFLKLSVLDSILPNAFQSSSYQEAGEEK